VGLRSSVYIRTPDSLNQSKLTLTLGATTDVVPAEAAVNCAPSTELFLGGHDGGDTILPEQEGWFVEQVCVCARARSFVHSSQLL
jgi:hypothetical protein